MATKQPRKMDFEKIIQHAENPKGFVAQTANGTAKAGNDQPGWNQQWNYEKPEAERRGPWKDGNRSGE